MCGINGFTWQDPALLRRMHRATHHRGPDDEGFFESEGISLAHNRLAIIDLSKDAGQPMKTQDKRYTIIYNGELYNYRELRRHLEALGESFRTQSDTEVLLAAFAKWGPGALKKFNGIFAFAVWDEQNKRLTLARDPIGVKPLYYWVDQGRLIFSSEIKGILEHEVPRVPDLDSLNLYFRMLYVPGPRTMFDGIKKLLPGHYAEFQDGKLTVHRYWSVKEGDAIKSREEAVNGIRERVLGSVKRQLVSDRPLGVFLSGGIDSSAVLGAMRDVHSGPIKTFTVGYEKTEQAERYNADARIAAQTSKYFGTEHHEFLMTADHVMQEFENVVRHMDEPIANHVQTSTYLLAKQSKPTITVALGGDGGDELFGGYPRYWYAHMLGYADHIPFARALHEKLRHRPGLDRHLSFILQKEEVISSFLKSDVIRPQITTSALSPSFESDWRDRVNQLMAADVQTWIPDESLMRTDKLTMAHALEERVPLLDHELVEYACRIPSAWKLGTRSRGKKIFIDAMKPYLPPHVLKEEKRAWMSPASKWLRGPLNSFAKEILSPDYAKGTEEFIDFAAVQKIFDDHVAVRQYNLNAIWALMTFQVWWKSFSLHKYKPTIDERLSNGHDPAA